MGGIPTCNKHPSEATDHAKYSERQDSATANFICQITEIVTFRELAEYTTVFDDFPCPNVHDIILI